MCTPSKQNGSKKDRWVRMEMVEEEEKMMENKNAHNGGLKGKLVATTGSPK